MAVPRNRLSSARKNIRRSHHAKKLRSFVKCPSCGAQKIAHCICHACGAYGERTVISKKESAE